jgi:hypothetical protein
MVLSPAQRRAFLAKHGRHVPLLAARGVLTVGAEGPWRWAELHRGRRFVCGYEWRHGSIERGGAVLLLPPQSRVAFVERLAA